jgi:hypothetical protein
VRVLGSIQQQFLWNTSMKHAYVMRKKLLCYTIKSQQLKAYFKAKDRQVLSRFHEY